MSGKLKVLLAVLLSVLMFGSAVMFVIVVTSPGTAYSPSKVKLDVDLITRKEILTCAYKVYGDDSQNMWVAKTIIKNVGKMPAYDFKISYKLGDLSDWNSGEEYPEIRPGQTVRDYCWPPMDPAKVQAITTKTPVELTMKYSYRGLNQAREDNQKVYLLGRNDFIFTSLPEKDIVTFSDAFDNYRFIAAFITPNEEVTKAFANASAGGLETQTSDDDAYEAFKRAFLSLRNQGVKYIQEPDAFWAGSAAQYVQYPKDTIERRAGTCLDLAIAVSALMEAVGVKSYVALIPGHAIPVVELANGDMYAIESTFLDKEYTLSHFPGVTGPDVTPDECITVAKDTLDRAQEEGTIIFIDPEYWWKQGVMPSW
ncbi:MAG: hypothetical protein KKF41_10655 [Actinobacteria bacterium]|nr:hypothetical protein [Actinomycetota bacterium]MBU1942202.1 hypothetical protein [Actinomycetota bacterium]MBU2688033.1 hypothetical protein [Actinomycetota bacterium]